MAHFMRTGLMLLALIVVDASQPMPQLFRPRGMGSMKNATNSINGTAAGRSGTAISGRTGSDQGCSVTTLDVTTTQIVNPYISTIYSTSTVTQTYDRNATITTSDISTVARTATLNATLNQTRVFSDTVTDHTTTTIAINATVTQTATTILYTEAPTSLQNGTTSSSNGTLHFTNGTSVSAPPRRAIKARLQPETSSANNSNTFTSDGKVCRLRTRTISMSGLPRSGMSTSCLPSTTTKTVTSFSTSYPLNNNRQNGTTTGTTVIVVPTTVYVTSSPQNVVTKSSTTTELTSENVSFRVATNTFNTTTTTNSPEVTTITLTDSTATTTSVMTETLTGASFHWSINADSCTAPCRWPGEAGSIVPGEGVDNGDQVDFITGIDGSEFFIDTNQTLIGPSDGYIAYRSQPNQPLQMLDSPAVPSQNGTQLYCNIDGGNLNCVDSNTTSIWWYACGDGWLWIGDHTNTLTRCSNITLGVIQNGTNATGGQSS